MIVDTCALPAFFNTREPDHEAVSAAIDDHDDGLLVVSPYVVAELDHLVATRIGADAEIAALNELSSGAWELADLGPPDLKSATAVMAKYRDQRIGVADASSVVLADRYRTRQILTLDRRHFDVLRPIGGGRFSILP